MYSDLLDLKFHTYKNTKSCQWHVSNGKLNIIWLKWVISYVSDVCKDFLFLLPDWPKLPCKNLSHSSFVLAIVLISWMVLSKLLAFVFQWCYDLGKLKWLHMYWLESQYWSIRFTYIDVWLAWYRQKFNMPAFIELVVW